MSFAPVLLPRPGHIAAVALPMRLGKTAVSRVLYPGTQQLTCCDSSLREVSCIDARLFAFSLSLSLSALNQTQIVGLGMESKTVTMRKAWDFEEDDIMRRRSARAKPRCATGREIVQNVIEDIGTDSDGTTGVVTFPTSVTATRHTPRPA